jgi:serine/threonine protein phosphatase PrpC
VTRLRAGAATDVGLVRANNQDQLLVDDPVFAVADGMGGHAAGEVASRTAVDALQIAFHDDDGSDGTGPEAVAEAVRAANRAVWEQAQAHAELRGMGTTLTAIALVPFTPAHGAAPGRDGLAVANVGDSRTYRLRHGQLEQLTVDHSYVAELVAEGRIDAAEAEFHPQRHVLTRALGVAPDVDVDLMTVDAEPDDRYLLCSDGLSREVTDAQIASVLRRLVDPGDAARELVAEAKRRGGNDNITVVGGGHWGAPPRGGRHRTGRSGRGRGPGRCARRRRRRAGAIRHACPDRRHPDRRHRSCEHDGRRHQGLAPQRLRHRELGRRKLGHQKVRHQRVGHQRRRRDDPRHRPGRHGSWR